MEIVLGLALFLLVITLVGHGLWVLARETLRIIVPTPPGAGGIGTTAPCPECGTPRRLPAGGAPCPACGGLPGDLPGAVPGRATPRPDLALAHLRRRVERFGQIGSIPAAARDRIVAAIREEERALAPPPADEIRWAGAEPAASPVVATPPPIAAPPPAVAPTARPLAPAARVRSYLEAREQAAAEPAPAGPAPAEPAPAADRPHRLFELLSAFLEEKSIRWGELVGGLLIVGCSLALVITFWASIAQRPLVKYVLLNGATALLFGLGMHAERRWKLPTTALGLLIIATLLTPLNFLAVASLVEGAATPSAWSFVGEAAATLMFGALVWRAGRSLVARLPWALMAGVVAPSASMLLLGRSLAPGRVAAVALALGALPWLGQGVALGGWIGRSRREAEFDEGRAAELLRLLGLGTFAASVALGFVVVHAGPGAGGGLARALSPLAPLVGGAILAPGLLLWRRVVAPGLVGYRTAGTAIAAAGTLILLAGIALAWPSPARVLPVALLDCAVFAAIAVAFRVPAAHGPAGACLGLAWLMGWGVASGRLGWGELSSGQAASVLLSAAAGAALVPVALGFGLAAVALARAGRRPDARAYALIAATAGPISLGLVTWHGFGLAGDPAGATWVYAAYALAAPAFAAWWARHPLVAAATGADEARALGWIGSGLLLAALVQGIVFGGLPVRAPLPWLAAVLAHATAMTAGSLARSARGRRTPDEDFDPIPAPGSPSGGLAAEVLGRSAVAGAIAGAGGLALAVPIGPPGALAADGCWLALILLGLARLGRSAAWFAAAQAALTWGVVFAVAAALAGRPWFDRGARPWLDPRMLQAQGLALGALGLGWIGLRLAARRRAKTLPTLVGWLDPPWPSFDRYARGAVVVLMVALAAYAAVPGAAQELTPRDVATRLAGAAPAGRVVPPIAAFEVPGVPHAPALGAGSWALGGLAIGLLLAGQWERFRRLDLLAALGVGTLAAPLVAGLWEPTVAVSSALRWSSALALLASSALIWDRDRLGRRAGRLGWRVAPAGAGAVGLPALATATALGLAALPLLAMGLYVAGAAVFGRPLPDRLGAAWAGSGVLFVLLGAASLAIGGGRAWVRPLLGALGALPLLAVSIFAVVTALQGNPMVGPEPGSFFRRVGQAGSFVPPILIVAATLVGYAVRERSARFAFAAGLAWNVTATVGLLTLAARAGLRLDAALAVRLAQLNAVVAATTALAWMGALVLARRRGRSIGEAAADDLLMADVALGVALVAAVVLGGAGLLLLDPVPRALHPVIAGPPGWLALAMVAGAVVARARLVGARLAPDWAGGGLLAAVVLLALGQAGRDPGGWRAYHALIAGLAALGMAGPAVAWWRAARTGAGPGGATRAAVERWSLAALGAVVLLAARGYWSDPQAPWWTVGGFLAMGALAAGLAAWTGRPGYLPAGCALVNLAATAWWLARPPWFASPSGWPALADLLAVNAVALALPAPLWLAIERHWPPRPDRRPAAPFHQFAAWAALGLLGLVVASCLGDEALGGSVLPSAVVGWAALGATALAMGAGLRDDRARAPVAGLYLLGLAAVGWVVAQFQMPPYWLAWTGTMVLAAYSVGTSFLWSRRAALRGLADRLGLPRPDRDDPVANLAWLVPANLMLAAVVLVLAFGSILLDDEVALRSSAAHAALAECLAIGLLARGARRTSLQAIVLGVGVAGAVAWGWAWIAPGSPTGFLDRAAVALAATMAGAALYGIGLFKLPRSEDDWTRAARRVVPALLGLAGAAALLVFAVELIQKAEGRAIALSPGGIALVALTLAGAVAAALVAAVVPGRDPLGLSDRGRTAYVYGAEGLIAGLGVHVRLTLPWLFSGFFLRYWPFLLMGVAFVGVGLGEVFRRQRRLVLAEPLERTGALLPALPLLAALWAAPRPGEDVAYLALTACLYATLGLMRSSVGFGALAALAGNGAFWSWLARQDDLGMLDHPQLWVIPPALCVLVGAYLNRDRLTAAQLAQVRYATATAIYLASTADIVLTGVARAPWLSAVLAGLSILGIFAGILLRVRGFLFLGVGFLALAVFSIIWYAAVDLHQTWLWAASGVVAGALILVVFAFFEKKRQDVLRVVGDLRGWDA